MRYGFGSTECPAGSVDLTALGAELNATLQRHKACLSAMGIDVNNTARSMPTATARGRVVLAAMECLQRVVFGEGRSRTCMLASDANTLREMLSVIGILCSYPETIETLRVCQKHVADAQILVRRLTTEGAANTTRIRQLEELQRDLEGDVAELSQRPESCAPCAAAPAMALSPLPQSAPVKDSGVSFGVALGGAAAAGVLGYAVTKMFSRRKKG